MFWKKNSVIVVISVFVCLLSGCKKKLEVITEPMVTPLESAEIAEQGEAEDIAEEKNPVADTEESPLPNPETNTISATGNTAVQPESTRSPERIQEIEEGKQPWQELYPAANVIWFEIDCHDGHEHLYYATNGMPLETWVGSRYNVDRWQKDGRNIVNVDCSLYLLTDGYEAASFALTEGMKFDTDYISAQQIYEGTPESRTGEAMLQYIEDFDEGVAVENGNIAVMDVDEGLNVASRTVYSYADGVLQSIVTTFYCEDSISDSYEGYLNDLGIYASVTRIGNTYKCVMPDEYAAQYLDYSRSTMRQILVDRYNYEHSY